MKTLKDLFEHQIKDLYSAEKQMIDSLSSMIEATTDTDLQTSFNNHLSETKTQFKRIQNICDELEINPTSTKCKAMEGLIEECKGMINSEAENEVKDAGLIACAQRIEHYEISAYGTAVRFAKELGHSNIAATLQTSLNEEYYADEHMGNLAKRRLNQKAMA